MSFSHLPMTAMMLIGLSVCACSGINSSTDAASNNTSNSVDKTTDVSLAGMTVFTGNDVPILSQLGVAFPGNQPKYYPFMRDAGVGTARISASWKYIEPRKGRYDWSSLDKRIIGLQNLGIDPFVTFESNVRWATTSETFGRVKNATPRSLDVWDGFVNAVVERYDADGQDDAPGLKRPVKWYQAANEWVSPRNKSGGWASTSDALIDYINTAHDAVKRADPDADFVMGGIASTNLDLLVNDLEVDNYLIQQYNNDGKLQVYSQSVVEGARVQNAINDRIKPVLRGANYDYLDLHLYGPEARDPARVAAIREIAKPKPMLTAECGGPTLDYGDRIYDPRDHFFAVMHRQLMVQSLDMPFCLWFRLGESKGATLGNAKTALYDRDLQPKPGYMGFKLLAVIMDEVSEVKNLSNTEMVQFEISRKNFTPIKVAWRVDRQPLTRRNIASFPNKNTRLIGQIDSGVKLATWPTDTTAETYLMISGTDLPATIQ